MPFPVKNVAYVFNITLVSQANPNIFQVTPTIAAGDFKVSTDDGAYANLATLPTVTPAGGKDVKISLSAGEMNGDRVKVVASDAAGAEWADFFTFIEPAASASPDANLTQILGTAITEGAAGRDAAAFTKFFDKATPTGTINSLPDAVAGAVNGLFIAGTNAATAIVAAAGSALTLTAAGNGHGLIATGKGTGNGLTGQGGDNSGAGMRVIGGAANGVGLHMNGVGSAAAAFWAEHIGSGAGGVFDAQGIGHGLWCVGGTTSGDGLKGEAVGGGSGLMALAVGTSSGAEFQGGSDGPGLALIGGANVQPALWLIPQGGGKNIKALFAELAAGAPVATPASVDDLLMLLYMALRNRGDLNAGTGFKIFYNDAGAAITKKAITDTGAGGVYSEAEMQAP